MNRRQFIVSGTALLAGLTTGSRVLAKEAGLKIRNLRMPPYNTTMMGVVKGALDYYEVNISAPMVFGASGHAFVINIHEHMDPSSPYVWKRNTVQHLIENLGLRMIDLGFYSPQNSREDRADVEKKLRDALDKGVACSLINLENQMITGYDDSGFFTTQPWSPQVKFPPARLTFGSWKEFGDELHVNFYVLENVKATDPSVAIIESLDYAVDLHRNPQAHSFDSYGIGPDAYANWINAAAEHGSSHGNWWNATVWGECRAMASKYFAEIGMQSSRAVKLTSQLEKAYADIAAALGRLSDKEMETKEKVKLLAETKSREAVATEMVADLAELLRTSGVKAP